MACCGSENHGQVLPSHWRSGFGALRHIGPPLARAAATAHRSSLVPSDPRQAAAPNDPHPASHDQWCADDATACAPPTEARRPLPTAVALSMRRQFAAAHPSAVPVQVRVPRLSYFSWSRTCDPETAPATPASGFFQWRNAAIRRPQRCHPVSTSSPPGRRKWPSRWPCRWSGRA